MPPSPDCGNEPKPSGTPECPEWLDEAARAYWDALVPRLQAMGVLGQSDETALTMLCVTWARWRDAVRVLRHAGEFYETIGAGFKTVVKRRPEAQIAKECEATLLRLLQEFGLSPAARPRIDASAVDEEELDPNSAGAVFQRLVLRGA